MRLKTLWTAGLFAVAMAYLEAAVVVYLRRMYDIVDPMAGLSSFDPRISAIELGRELATLVMLGAFGWVAGTTVRSRFAYAMFAFGVWDIFYYVWLKAIVDWPQSIFDMDILFLIPLPWAGPILAPVCIAALMVAGGARIIIAESRGHATNFRPYEIAILVGGAVIVLYTFLAPSLSVLPANTHAFADMRPSTFKWPLYLIGLSLSAYAVFHGTKSTSHGPSR